MFNLFKKRRVSSENTLGNSKELDLEEYLVDVEGPDRDLNYAIKNGSKKVIGLINKHSQKESSTVSRLLVKQLFTVIAKTDINDKKVIN